MLTLEPTSTTLVKGNMRKSVIPHTTLGQPQGEGWSSVFLEFKDWKAYDCRSILT